MNNLVRVVHGSSPAFGPSLWDCRLIELLFCRSYFSTLPRSTGTDVGQLLRRNRDLEAVQTNQKSISRPKSRQLSHRMFIGYASMDEGTVRLLTQGKNRVDLKESARWGYASYVTDKPDM